MATTDIVGYACASTANVLAQSSYLTAGYANGMASGIVPSNYFNKAIRQASFVAASVAQFCVNQNVSVPDDGVIVNLAAAIASAVQGLFASTVITASLATNISLTTPGAYIDGPTINQPKTGTWWVEGDVTVFNSAGQTNVSAVLWDGTNYIDSCSSTIVGAGQYLSINLSGPIVNPVGNLRVSVTASDASHTSIVFNQTVAAKDSTISAFRL